MNTLSLYIRIFYSPINLYFFYQILIGLILLYLLKHRCCILFLSKHIYLLYKCQKQHNTNKQTQPKKQKRRERFIFLLSFSIRSISFMLFSITSCPVSVILIMHIHFTFHLRLYKYYEGDSNFILKIFNLLTSVTKCSIVF